MKKLLSVLLTILLSSNVFSQETTISSKDQYDAWMKKIAKKSDPCDTIIIREGIKIEKHCRKNGSNDTIYSDWGWLVASSNSAADTRKPYLSFTIEKHSLCYWCNTKRKEITIHFEGKAMSTKYVPPTMPAAFDSVEIEFENHEKIKFSKANGDGIVLAYNEGDMANIDNYIILNENDIKKLLINPIYQISFSSSPDRRYNKQCVILGTEMVNSTFTKEIMNYLNALMK